MKPKNDLHAGSTFKTQGFKELETGAMEFRPKQAAANSMLNTEKPRVREELE